MQQNLLSLNARDSDGFHVKFKETSGVKGYSVKAIRGFLSERRKEKGP